MKTLEQRYWAQVDLRELESGDCWGWSGAVRAGGYGQLWVGPRPSTAKVAAHRMSYELHYGLIPKGAFVLHRCDNPLCTNPAHLVLGDHTENMRQMRARGRSRHGERCHNAKLTEADILEIRRRSLEEPQRALAAEFGVSRSCIGQIVRRERWAHLAIAGRKEGK